MLTAQNVTTPRPVAPPCGSGTISYSKSARTIEFVGPCSFCGGDSDCSRCHGRDWLSVDGDAAIEAAGEAIKFARTWEEKAALGTQLARAIWRDLLAFRETLAKRPVVCVNGHERDIAINDQCMVCAAPVFGKTVAA